MPKKPLLGERAISLRYGDGEERVSVPAERVLFEVGPRRFPVLEDPVEELGFSLRDPIGPDLSEVIGPGERVLVVTVDRTRPSPKVLLGALVAALEEAGARVSVVVATGLHRRMSPAELKTHLGTTQVLQHDCDGETLSLGRTSRGTPIELSHLLGECDKVVTLGFVEPQYLMGFGGGRKLIFPGLGSRRAITHHHLMLAQAGFQLGRLAGNPLDEDVVEMIRRLGLWPEGPLAFSVNPVLNPDESVVEVFSGDLLQAHQEACRLARRLYTVSTPRRCDILLVSPGGYPHDRDLVQSRKALVAGCRAVRPGGAIILLAQCREGWAADEGSRPWLVDASPKQIVAEMNARYRRRADSAADPPEGCASVTAALLFAFILEFCSLEVIVVSELDGLEETFLLTAGSLAEALELAESRVGSLSSIGVIHQGRRLIIP